MIDETIRRVVAWPDRVGLERIVSIAQVGNDASERIMGKLGMRLERDTVDPACGAPGPGPRDHQGAVPGSVPRTATRTARPGVTTSGRDDLGSLISSLIHPRTPASISVHRSSLSRQRYPRGLSCTVILKSGRLAVKQPRTTRPIANAFPGHRHAAALDCLLCAQDDPADVRAAQ